MRDNLRDLSISNDYQNFGNAAPLLVVGVFIMISPYVLRAIGIDWGWFNWVIHIIGFLVMIVGGLMSVAMANDNQGGMY